MVIDRKTRTPKAGFTMIELLVVIAIIGTLSTFFLFTFPGAQRRARDAQRKNDLKQFQTAIETYYVEHGAYPIFTGSGGSTLCALVGLSTCASDPRAGQASCSGQTCAYSYTSNSTGSAYVLYAPFEQPTAQPYWEICSSGQTGEGGIAPSAGGCTVGSIAPTASPTSTPVTPPPTTPPPTTPPPTTPPPTR